MKREATSRPVLASALLPGDRVIEPISGVVAPVLGVRTLDNGDVDLKLGAPANCWLQRPASCELRQVLKVERPPTDLELEQAAPQHWIGAGRKGWKCSRCQQFFSLRGAHECASSSASDGAP